MHASEIFRLDGSVAVVTGSTKGIGRAMVQGLAEAGASVVVSSRKQELCDEVAREVTESTGSPALGLACHEMCIRDSSTPCWKPGCWGTALK